MNNCLGDRMKEALLTILCAAVMLIYGEAFAYLRTANQRLDHAIYSGHAPKLIVAGQIEEKVTIPSSDAAEISPDELMVMEPADVSVRFKVTTVILGQQTYRGQTLVIPATTFMWPTELLPFEKGVRCALVLRTDSDEKGDSYHLISVVPVSNTVLPTAPDGEGAKRILEAELLEELKNEPAVSRQWHLVLQVSPILQEAESGVLVPFLTSDNVWLSRATLAGILSATKDLRYLEMAYEDIEQFIKTTDPSSIINDFKPGRGFHPFSLLVSHYFFLSMGWSREEDATARAYLPLFRLVAHNKKIPEGFRWAYGVRPLCRIGTRKDAKFFYDYCHLREHGKEKDILRHSSNRQEIIMAVSRILNLGLSNWVELDFLKKEPEQHQQISKALVREGIINKGEVHHHSEQGAEGDAGTPAP